VTRDEIIIELRELERDLYAFKAARDCVHIRLREQEDRPERQAMMKDWPAFGVIDNGLILAIVRCEGLLEDYRNLLDQEEIPDNVLRMEKSR
jgi:hypothetical protein